MYDVLIVLLSVLGIWGLCWLGLQIPTRWRWPFLLPAHIALTVLRYPLAVVAVVGFSSNDKLSLRWPFGWLMTQDVDLRGDGGWQAEHMIGSDPLATVNRIRWLWRNGGHAINYGLLGVAQDDTGAWAWRRFWPVLGRYIEVYCGWALEGPQGGRCKYVCTFRGRTSTN